MRAREFLLEYSREKTAAMFGDKLITALLQDLSAPATVLSSARTLGSLTDLGKPWWNLNVLLGYAERSDLTPEERKQVINNLLAVIEQKDPTTTKEYTPWLARIYANGGWTLEPAHRGGTTDLFRLYDLAKKRRMLQPEHKDINNFKSYNDLLHTMTTDYDLGEIEAAKPDPGRTKKIYSDDDVTVIVPEDEAGSRRIGRGTGWCTAWTNRPSRFDQYNRDGPLYVIVPKHAKHEGEKYQLHFPKSEFKDESNKDVSLNYILFERFPELLEFFKKIEHVPEPKDEIEFADNETIQNLVDDIKQAGLLYFDGVLNTAEIRRNLNDNDIDAVRNMLDINYDVDGIKQHCKGYHILMSQLPEIMADISKEKKSSKGSLWPRNIAAALSRKIKKQGGNWVLTK